MTGRTYLDVVRLIRETRGLSASDQAVLDAIGERVNWNSGEGCWMSNALIAEKSRLSLRTVQRRLRVLEERGIIIVARRSVGGRGPKATNLLHLDLAMLGPDTGDTVTPQPRHGVVAAPSLCHGSHDTMSYDSVNEPVREPAHEQAARLATIDFGSSRLLVTEFLSLLERPTFTFCFWDWAQHRLDYGCPLTRLEARAILGEIAIRHGPTVGLAMLEGAIAHEWLNLYADDATIRRYLQPDWTVSETARGLHRRYESLPSLDETLTMPRDVPEPRGTCVGYGGMKRHGIEPARFCADRLARQGALNTLWSHFDLREAAVARVVRGETEIRLLKEALEPLDLELVLRSRASDTAGTIGSIAV